MSETGDGEGDSMYGCDKIREDHFNITGHFVFRGNRGRADRSGSVGGGLLP